MGATNTKHYSPFQNSLAICAKALGHPARLEIINFLLNSESCLCKDIVALIPLSQPTIAQHLSKLHHAGIIIPDISGNEVRYSLNLGAVIELNKYLNALPHRLIPSRKLFSEC